MPNINIYEQDLTSGGSTSYSNFTVAVPGFVQTNHAPKFDDNGILEFTTAEEFFDTIGVVKPSSEDTPYTAAEPVKETGRTSLIAYGTPIAKGTGKLHIAQLDGVTYDVMKESSAAGASDKLTVFTTYDTNEHERLGEFYSTGESPASVGVKLDFITGKIKRTSAGDKLENTTISYWYDNAGTATEVTSEAVNTLASTVGAEVTLANIPLAPETSGETTLYPITWTITTDPSLTYSITSDHVSPDVWTAGAEKVRKVLYSVGKITSGEGLGKVGKNFRTVYKTDGSPEYTLRYEKVSQVVAGEAYDNAKDLVAGGSETDYMYAVIDLTNEYTETYEDCYPVYKAGSEGKDVAVANVAHYGNQIAYNLLKLGYRVLYKKLTGLEELTKADYWTPLKDRTEYDFRYIINGTLSDNVTYAFKSSADTNIINVATGKSNSSDDNSITGRGDCTALVDINERGFAETKASGQSGIITYIRQQAMSSTDFNKYTGLFTPAVSYVALPEPGSEETARYNNKTLPASFHYLACAKRALNNNFPEWFAVSGYTRGIADLTPESTTINLGDTAVQSLQPRVPVKYTTTEGTEADYKKSVNIVVRNKGSYYVWGNRACETLTEEDLKASHFLNIRQLCSTIKKDVYNACRKFTFDPNSDTLWVNFVNAIRPTLDKMKANQGVRDYRIEKVVDSKKAVLSAKIRIDPIEAVEDFDITLSLEDNLGSTTVTIEE